MADDDLMTAKMIQQQLPRLVDQVQARARDLREAKNRIEQYKKRRNRIIVDSHKQGVSIREIARQLDMPVATVASIYQAGK